MKRFTIRIALFLSIFIVISIISSIVLKNDKRFDFRSFTPNPSLYFAKKKPYFEDFIRDKKSINLLLGSSILEDAIIPDSLGEKWFSFALTHENIYNSYKFLEYYKDSVIIDTIIISLVPFDFPYSYIENRNILLPGTNLDFIAFGHDSISNLYYRDYTKKMIQLIIDFVYFDIENLIIGTKKLNINKGLKRFLSKQGFSGRIHIPGVDMDSRYKLRPELNNKHIRYFYNVNDIPNMKYFQLFNSYCQENNINVIYLLSPKSKYYHMNLEKVGNDILWQTILDSVNSYNITIWDYEKLNTDSMGVKFHWDEAHLSYEGAKKFTKILKHRLYGDNIHLNDGHSLSD
ncbi:MAG: hypothetical protein IIB94_13450 [Candidatus Marinimicrobia bacterium]|nr:hypothetical protein [Candidatus Neomarinimicrobiota bacterium]